MRGGWGVRAGRPRDDDELDLTWEGPFAWVMRPITLGTLRRMSDAVALLFLLAVVASLPLTVGWADPPGRRPGLMLIVTVSALFGTAYCALYHRVLRPEQMARLVPVLAFGPQVVGPLIVSIAVVGSGPVLGIAAVYYVQTPLVGFMFFRTRWAVGITAIEVVVYALALWVLDSPPVPGEQLLIVGCAALATSALIGDFARRFDAAQRAEHEARRELADLNDHLEARVAEQVDQLDRLGQLRRFLAPQVADVVVSRGSEALLEPHRRDVAVLFCDLRGFTRFTNSVDADAVVAVLGEYYATVGPVLEAHGATIGGYDGDGIMAYLGDPIPRPDAAEAAVSMAREIGRLLDDLAERWRAAGHDLSYGIGLAHGEAVLGVVGFDGRFDYTPLGAVVNLAARLCGDAGPGELVVDASMVDVAGGARHRGDVVLKGYAEPVATYLLAR